MPAPQRKKEKSSCKRTGRRGKKREKKKIPVVEKENA